MPLKAPAVVDDIGLLVVVAGLVAVVGLAVVIDERVVAELVVDVEHRSGGGIYRNPPITITHVH